LYRAAGLSKQAFHQFVERKLCERDECEQLLPIIKEIRKEYPTMSAREMHRIIQPVKLGRDKFEKFCFEEGFKLERRRAFHRTTNSLGVTRFPNLIQGLELEGINHVWVSDITYYRIDERFFYLTFIMDLYSRKILGHSVSKDLLTENTTIPAMKMAVDNRNGIRPKIFHSDGGGQYYSKQFRALTGTQIANSMGECAYENPHAERLNGLIKNDYLVHYNPRNMVELIVQTNRAVHNYNRKNHSSIKTNPMQFELLTNSQLLTKEKKKQKKKTLQQINTFVNLKETVNLIQA
jgi:transposase InsO family protein